MSVGIMAANMDSTIRKVQNLNTRKSSFSIDSIMSSKTSDVQRRKLCDHTSAPSEEDMSRSSPSPLRIHRRSHIPEPLSKERIADSRLDPLAMPLSHHDERGLERLTGSPSLSHTDNHPMLKTRVTTTPPSYRPYPSPQTHLPSHHHRHLQSSHRPPGLLTNKHFDGLGGIKSLPPHLTPPYHPSQLSALDQISALYAQQNGLASLGGSSLSGSPFNTPVTGMHLPAAQKHYSPLQIPMYAPWQGTRPGFMYPSFPGVYPTLITIYHTNQSIKSTIKA